MKSKITEIINQVSNRTISTDEAIDEILHLFSVSKCDEPEREPAACDGWLHECNLWHKKVDVCYTCNKYKGY